MSRNYVRELWYTLEEPRVVTALMMSAYTATCVLGVAIMMGITGEATLASTLLRGLVGFMLISAGTVGIPAAWSGAQWPERFSSLAMAGGFGAWAVHLAGTHLDPDTVTLAAPVTTIVALILAVIFAITRFTRVILNPYAAGKGPMLPEVEARLQDTVAKTLA